METIGRDNRSEEVDRGAVGIALMKLSVRLGGKLIHPFEQLFACGVGTGERGVDRDGPEPQLLVAAEGDPSEVVIDAISCQDSKEAFVRSRMPLDLLGKQEDEGLAGIAGEGIESAFSERRHRGLVGSRQLIAIR